jgi:hypothetical protein
VGYCSHHGSWLTPLLPPISSLLSTNSSLLSTSSHPFYYPPPLPTTSSLLSATYFLHLSITYSILSDIYLFLEPPPPFCCPLHDHLTPLDYLLPPFYCCLPPFFFFLLPFYHLLTLSTSSSLMFSTLPSPTYYHLSTTSFIFSPRSSSLLSVLFSLLKVSPPHPLLYFFPSTFLIHLPFSCLVLSDYFYSCSHLLSPSVGSVSLPPFFNKLSSPFIPTFISFLFF